MTAARKTRVGFVTSHPIQYHAAWFRALASEPSLDFEVLYCHEPAPTEQGTGFGVSFAWDVPLLGGYRHRFLRNVATQPTLNAFQGLDTPELRALVSRNHYDAVVINGWHYKSAWQAIRAGWKNKVPVLMRSDSHLHTPRHPLKRLLKAAPYRWFIPKLDGCLAVGQWSAEYFVHFGASPDRDGVFRMPPEKALLDLLYVQKGGIDWGSIDTRRLDRGALQSMAACFPTPVRRALSSSPVWG